MTTNVKVRLFIAGWLASSTACGLEQLDGNALEAALDRDDEHQEEPQRSRPEPLVLGARDASEAPSKDVVACTDAGVCARPKQPRQPPPPGCERLTIEASRCLAWEDTKGRLATQCAAQGLELTKLSHEGKDGCARDTARETSGLCCPPEEPGGCETRFTGDGHSCYDPTSIEALADAECGATNGEWPWLAAEEDNFCGPGLHSRITYICCPDGKFPTLRD